jgi:hypothetical protein
MDGYSAGWISQPYVGKIFHKSSAWFAGYLEGGLAGYTALTALLTTTLSQQ